MILHLMMVLVCIFRNIQFFLNVSVLMRSHFISEGSFTERENFYCLSNRKLERLGGPLDEVVTVSVTQIQRHNVTS